MNHDTHIIEKDITSCYTTCPSFWGGWGQPEPLRALTYKSGHLGTRGVKASMSLQGWSLASANHSSERPKSHGYINPVLMINNDIKITKMIKG